MNTRKVFIIVLFLAFHFLVKAQENNVFQNNDSIINYNYSKSDSAKNIIQDKRIDELVQRHIQYNKYNNGILGYRIRIYSNLGKKARSESDNARARFYGYFPEIPIYRKYESPYFKVYVGNFRTMNDALNILKRVKHYFPEAFIIHDKINFPKLDE